MKMLLQRLSYRFCNNAFCLRNTNLHSRRLTVPYLWATNLRSASIDAAPKNTSTVKKQNFDAKDENDVLQKLKQMFSDEMQDGGVVPIFKRALLYGNKIAIKDDAGEYTYAQLYTAAKMLSTQISNLCGSASNSRIAFLCSNTALYTLVQWACWMSGQVAVPLYTHHPPKLLEYYIKNSEASLIVSVPEYEKIMAPLAESLQKPIILVDHSFIPAIPTPTTSSQSDSWLDPKNENVLMFNDQPIIEGTLNSQFYAKSNAMIIYTSGTTSMPKGTVLTFKSIESQTKCLTEAWRITDKDVLLNCLPLHHMHGIVNALACPLKVGAKVFMLPKFDSSNVWSVLLNINIPSKDRISVFMGVPTHYNKLISEYDKVFSKNERMVEFIRAQCEKKIRLMVCGSAPLPTPIYDKWYDITGHKLLIRYGMTEIGMFLSNTYEMDDVRTRTGDSVGMPLPDCEVKLVNNGQTVFEAKGEYGKCFWNIGPLQSYEKLSKTPPKTEEISGEIYVRGPNVFKEYFKRPKETAESFDNGWFKTGDIAKYENGVFKILGRMSADIIKTGGYKVSALEIETVLLAHSDILDACVVGVDDMVWGQKVAAIIVLKDTNNNGEEIPELKEWCLQRMASYQVPTLFKYVKEMPRNAMGKVNKKTIVTDLFPTEQ